ncbi:MAG: hypothetical protein LBC43_01745 [Bifidobacteriaceae bacterium]|jgi:hypothetical protein|nr:hypothetical protein [Bifidobacteriaceae bacterium]
MLSHGRRRSSISAKRNVWMRVAAFAGCICVGLLIAIPILVGQLYPQDQAGNDLNSLSRGFGFDLKIAAASETMAGSPDVNPLAYYPKAPIPNYGLVSDTTDSNGFTIPGITKDLFVELPKILNEPDYSNLTPGVLSPGLGTVIFEGHRETWYNLDMSYFGPYDVRNDGAKVKPNGDIILACHTDYRGQRRLTSLGWGICLDTGGFAFSDHEQVDIAVNW